MIAYQPKPEPDDILGALPNVKAQESEMAHIFRNVQFILRVQGFELEPLGNDYVLTHQGKELMIAPSMGDAILLLCVTGAWANVRGK